ncbi:IS66 family transposase [Lactobacillus amylovorus]|uniref:IS66 family transposase n=1 Tax=Lactobacillus amylovorus TaxID=1604 RepID=UPI0015D08940|nr:IS66 family transposase [Lactobacillus amylovorus]
MNHVRRKLRKDQQSTTIQNLTAEIKLLREQVAYLTQKRYGKSSEQMPLSGQLKLFDEEKQDSDDGERPRCCRSDYYL